MSDALDSLMRGDVASVKLVLASVAAALAVYQLVLIAVGYGKLRPPFLGPRPASETHRASGDTIVVLLVLLGVACVGAYGFEDDMVVHAAAGALLVAVAIVAVTIAIVVAQLGPNADDGHGGKGSGGSEQSSGHGRGD